MNEDPTDLERELRRLQPMKPDQRLIDRIAEVLDQPGAGAPRLAYAWWQRLGFNRPAAALGWGLLCPASAACVAILVAGHLRTEVPLPSPSTAPAVAHGGLPTTSGTQAVNVLYQTLDEGVVSNDGQEAVRRVRYRSADRVSWHNPQSGAQWEVSYPREDVLLIPVQAE